MIKCLQIMYVKYYELTNSILCFKKMHIVKVGAFVPIWASKFAFFRCPVWKTKSW